MATRRNKGDGSLRKRPDGRWEARYTVTDLSGEPIRKAVYGKTQKEVREKLKLALADYEYFGYKEPEKVTIGEWMDSWLDSKRLGLSQSTYTNYRDRIQIIKSEMGGRMLRDTETRHLQKFLNGLIDKTDAHPAYSPATIIKTKNVLNAAMEQAVREHIIRYNPARDLKAPKLVQKEIRILTKEEQQRFIDSLDGHRLKPLYLLALATGLRRGEILALTWDCVDFENQTIAVKKSIGRIRNLDGKGSQLVISEPKSKAGKRTVPLVDSLVPVLQEHKQKQEIEKQRAGSAWNSENIVFCSTNGTHIEPRRVVTTLEKLLKVAEVENVNFHALRHTFATRMLERGANARVVKDILGHEDVTLTLNTYSHVIGNTAHEQIARIDGLFTRPNAPQEKRKSTKKKSKDEPDLER